MKLSGPLIPVIALGAGISSSYIFATPWWIGFLLIAIAISIYVIILQLSKTPITAYKKAKWHPAWVIILFLGIGVIAESLSRPLSLEDAFENGLPQKVECEVNTILTKTYGDRLDVTINGTNGAKARIITGVTTLSPGDIISLPTARLKEIATDTSKIIREIAPMMKANGFLYTARILPSKIEAKGHINSIRYQLMSIREDIEMHIDYSNLSKQTSEFLKAILLGDKNGLDENIRLTFASGGTSHILALSGLHLGILAGFIMLFLWPVRLSGQYKLGYMIAIVLLWTYVLITGLPHSAVRACIMATFAFLAIIIERKNFAGHALASSCLLILLFDPHALFDAGFQLSVVCVGALIAYASHLNPIGHRHHPVLFSVCGMLIATMVATAASWVLISYYFGQIPLLFLPANIVVLPLLPAYLGISVVYIIFIYIGFDLLPLQIILDKGYDFMLWATDLLSAGGEYMLQYRIPLWGVLLWLGILSAGAYLLNRNRNEGYNRVS